MGPTNRGGWPIEPAAEQFAQDHSGPEVAVGWEL